MVDHELVAKWVVDVAVLDHADVQSDEFIEAARMAWPRVLACTRRSVSNRQATAAETISLTLEIWEVALRSVWRTLQQCKDGESKIENLSNYLIGAFRHRLNQHLKKDKHRNAVLEFVPPEELDGLEQSGGGKEDGAVRIHRQIQLMEVYTAMDDYVRQAIMARSCGFSWREIANEMGANEQNLTMRVQYAIRKMRDKFARLPNGPKPDLTCV
jgi:DNA-directed RNA polymerase specialized sigma24 family protein